LPIEEEIVPRNTMRCPPIKMGAFGRILAKKERFKGILRRIGEKRRKKAFTAA